MPNLTSSNKIKILGKNYNNTNVTSLRKNLGIKEGSIKESNNVVRAIRSNVEEPKVIYNKNTGNFEKLSLESKPLVIRKFLDKNRVSKKLRNNIISSEPFETTNSKGETVYIYDKTREFNDDDRLNIMVKVKFWIEVSDIHFGRVSGKRDIEFMYLGKIGDLKGVVNLWCKSLTQPVQIVDQDDVDFSEIIFEEQFVELDDKVTYSEFNVNKNSFTRQLFGNLRRSGYFGKFDLFIYKIEAYSTNGSDELDLKSMKLRKVNYDNITVNLFNEIIDITDNNNNCVVSYLSEKYPKLNVETFFSDELEEGISSEQILDFCNENNMKCIAYDIKGNVIVKNDIVNRKIKPLVFIAYNNHIYPLKNKVLKMQDDLGLTFKYLDHEKVFGEFKKVISKRIIPKDVKIYLSNNKPIINGFTHKKVVHHSNKDFDDCKKILDVFGCGDKISEKITRFTIFGILSELYGIQDYSSFNPFLNNYTVPGFMYHKDVTDSYIEQNKSKIITRDKNKAYGNSLYEIDYFYVCDLKYDEVIKNPTDELDNSSVYIIEPTESSILIPKTGYYTGEDLEYFDQEGLQYKRLYEIKSKKVDNKYKTLIKDFYEKTSKLQLSDPKIVKNIVNIFIGKLERGEHLKNKIEFTKICNFDEAEKSGKGFIDIINDYCASYEEVVDYDTKNYKMMAIQIKNRCRRTVYEEMKRLNIKTDDIIQINTDSISYVKTKTNKNDKTNINENDFRKWKSIPYKKATTHEFEVLNESIDLERLIKQSRNRNLICLGYAGCGKTKSVIEKLIPQLTESGTLYDEKKDEKKDEEYIILTPSHASLQQYRKNDYPCDVIQKYCYNTRLDSKYKSIIVDEIGMCDRKSLDFLYKSTKQGIRVFAYGDFNQLPPVDKNGESRKVSSMFIDLLFSKIERTTKNYRNKFTIEYYDQLINSKLDLIEEINKHSEDDYNNAEVVICYRHDTVDKYNNLIMEEKGIDNETPGCKIICKTNNMRKYNIYNNYVLEITEVNEEDNTIKMKDESSEYEIPLDVYRRGVKRRKDKKEWFKPAYAKTIYSLQGATIDSYYIAQEDIKFFNNPNTAYTIISRKRDQN
jgi:hypothetical protein